MPKESRAPEEMDLEREYDEEVKGEELPEEEELDPFAERFYELSSRTYRTETELDEAVNRILNDIERDCFFKGLFKKTKKGGKLLLKKGLETFKGFSAFQAASGITQLARGNLKGTLGTLAKVGLKGARVGAALPTLEALGFETGKEGTTQKRRAWQNFTDVCKESFDYLATNLSENADDPLEANRLASEAFSAALKKVKSERQRAFVQKTRKTSEKAGQRMVIGKTATLALGVICIVLAAGLIGAIAVYVPTVNNLQSQMKDKDSTISSLNSTNQVLANKVAQLYLSLNQSQSSLSDLQSEVAYLNSSIIYLNNIVILNASDYLVYDQPINQAAGANNTIFNNPLDFAGYVSVVVQSSSNTTYVELAYSSYGVSYDKSVIVGTSGTAAFPILPGTIVITVGNTETVNSVNGTITATYHA
jgi:hypothetical protein